jgi:hypothetical protein
MQRQSKNNAMRDESTQIALLISIFCSLHAAASEDVTWYPRRGLKRAKNGLLSADWS